MGDMDRESDETQLPADAGRARPVFTPVFRKMCGVRECKPGLAGSIFREAYVHPAYVSAELPCEREVWQAFVTASHGSSMVVA